MTNNSLSEITNREQILIRVLSDICDEYDAGHELSPLELLLLKGLSKLKSKKFEDAAGQNFVLRTTDRKELRQSKKKDKTNDLKKKNKKLSKAKERLKGLIDKKKIEHKIV